MKSASKKAALGLAGIVCLAAVPVAQAADYVPMTSFATDPTAAGWSKSGGTAGWSGAALTSGNDGWYSPVFAPTPGSYYKVQYDALLSGTGTGQFGTFFGNAAATYDREPLTNGLYRKTSTGANVVNGQLLADNYTVIKPAAAGWSPITEFTRVPVNATQSFAYFGANTTGASIDNVRISPATHAEVLAWADNMYNNTATFPTKLAYTPPLNRYANMPKTETILKNRQTLNVVMLGDSIMGDTENGGFDVMIERNYPGSNVVVNSAVGHGTGMYDWLHATDAQFATSDKHMGLKLREAVYDRNADLVILGGISNGGAANLAATLTIVQALKAQGTEVLINTGMFGSYGNVPLPSTFVGTIDGITRDTDSDPSLPYRNSMFNLAKDEGVAFFDTYGAWGTYLKELTAVGTGKTESDYYRDFWTHANTPGKDMIGRLYEGYFTPVPEPTSLGLLILGGAGLIARRRKAL